MLRYTIKDREALLAQSITQYKHTIFNDINLSMRIIDSQEVSQLTRIIKWEDSTIYFFAPISKGDFVLYTIGDILEIHFITNSGIYHSHLKVLGKERKDNNLYYTGELCKPIIRKQQREYFRLSTLLNLKFSILVPDILPDHVYDLPKIPAISTNISAGGMCILSSAELSSEDTIYIYLDFLSTPIEVIGEILTVTGKNEHGNYTYRIRFKDLSTRTRDLITKLIFEKQRLERSSNSSALK